MVSFDDIARAHQRIQPQAKRTPVLTSATVDAHTGAKVFFKCENFQRMGAFKFRGAYNALSQLTPEQAQRGPRQTEERRRPNPQEGGHPRATALAGPEQLAHVRRDPDRHHVVEGVDPPHDEDGRGHGGGGLDPETSNPERVHPLVGQPQGLRREHGHREMQQRARNRLGHPRRRREGRRFARHLDQDDSGRRKAPLW